MSSSGDTCTLIIPANSSSRNTGNNNSNIKNYDYKKTEKIRWCSGKDLEFNDEQQCILKSKGYVIDGGCIKIDRSKYPTEKQQVDFCTGFCSSDVNSKNCVGFTHYPDKWCCFRSDTSSKPSSSSSNAACYEKIRYQETLGCSKYPYTKEQAEQACKDAGYTGLCFKNDVQFSDKSNNLCCAGWTKDGPGWSTTKKRSGCGHRGWNPGWGGRYTWAAHCCGPKKQKETFTNYNSNKKNYNSKDQIHENFVNYVKPIPLAKSCNINAKCDKEGQYCPPNVPGSNKTDGYCCKNSRWQSGTCSNVFQFKGLLNGISEINIYREDFDIFKSSVYQWGSPFDTSDKVWWFKIDYTMENDDTITFIWCQNWWVDQESSSKKKDKDYGFLEGVGGINMDKYINRTDGLSFKGLYKQTSDIAAYVGVDNSEYGHWAVGLSIQGNHTYRHDYNGMVPIPGYRNTGAKSVSLEVLYPPFNPNNYSLSFDISGLWDAPEANTKGSNIVKLYVYPIAKDGYAGDINYDVYETNKDSKKMDGYKKYKLIMVYDSTGKNFERVAFEDLNGKELITPSLPPNQAVLPMNGIGPNIYWSRVSGALESLRSKAEWKTHTGRVYYGDSDLFELPYDPNFCTSKINSNVWGDGLCGINNPTPDKIKKAKNLCKDWELCKAINCSRDSCVHIGKGENNTKELENMIKNHLITRPAVDTPIKNGCSYSLEMPTDKETKTTTSNHKINNINFKILNISGRSGCNPNKTVHNRNYGMKNNCITSSGYDCPDSYGMNILSGPNYANVANKNIITNLTNNFKLATRPYTTANNIAFKRSGQVGGNCSDGKTSGTKCYVNGYTLCLNKSRGDASRICDQLSKQSYVKTNYFVQNKTGLEDFLKTDIEKKNILEQQDKSFKNIENIYSKIPSLKGLSNIFDKNISQDKLDENKEVSDIKSIFQTASVPLKCSLRTNGGINKCQAQYGDPSVKVFKGTNPETPCLFYNTDKGNRCLNLNNLIDQCKDYYNKIKKSSVSLIKSQFNNFQNVKSKVIDNVITDNNCIKGEDCTPNFAYFPKANKQNMEWNPGKIVEDFENYNSSNSSNNSNKSSIDNNKNVSWGWNTASLPPITNIQKTNKLFYQEPLEIVKSSSKNNVCFGTNDLDSDNKNVPYSFNVDPAIIILIDPNSRSLDDKGLINMVLHSPELVSPNNSQQSQESSTVWNSISRLLSFYVKIDGHKMRIPNNFINCNFLHKAWVDISNAPILKKWFGKSKDDNKIYLSSEKVFIVNSLKADTITNDDGNSYKFIPPINFMYHLFKNLGIPKSNYIPLECFFSITTTSGMGTNSVIEGFTSGDSTFLNKSKLDEDITNKFKNIEDQSDDISKYNKEISLDTDHDFTNNLENPFNNIKTLNLKNDIRPKEWRQIEWKIADKGRYNLDFAKKNIYLYNIKTELSNTNINTINSKDSTLHNLIKKSNLNDKELTSLNNRLDTTKRQHDINTNNEKKINKNELLLKILLIYSIIILIPLILSKMYPKVAIFKYLKIFIICISLPIVIFVIKYVYGFRNNSNINTNSIFKTLS